MTAEDLIYNIKSVAEQTDWTNALKVSHIKSLLQTWEDNNGQRLN